MALFDAEPARVLSHLLSSCGPVLASDCRRLKALLADALPDRSAECALVVMACELGIPVRIEREALASDFLLSSLSDSLVQDRFVNPDAARWTLETWAVALGKKPMDGWTPGASLGTTHGSHIPRSAANGSACVAPPHADTVTLAGSDPPDAESRGDTSSAGIPLVTAALIGLLLAAGVALAVLVVLTGSS